MKALLFAFSRKSSKMPTSTQSTGRHDRSLPVERSSSSSSSSLRGSPSKQSTASKGKTSQKSSGRLSIRVPSAPVARIRPSTVDLDSPKPSFFEDKSTRGLQGEPARDVPTAEDTAENEMEKENATLHLQLQELQQELEDLRTGSRENDEVWQRDNARLKELLVAAKAREANHEEQLRAYNDQLEAASARAIDQEKQLRAYEDQLAAVNSREAAQQEQLREYERQLAKANTGEATQEKHLRVCEQQLALCRQELYELQEYQIKKEQEYAAHVCPSSNECGSSGPGRERALLKLVVQLVGAANVRFALRDNPNASPEQLCEALVRLRCPQCRLLKPPSRSTSQCKGKTNKNPESLHEMLFGGSLKSKSPRPPSPPTLRFSWMGSQSPDK